MAYAANLQRRIDSVARWQKKNPESVKRHAKATYQRNLESRRQRLRDAYQKSKLTPNRAAADRAAYLKNRESRLAAVAKYQAKFKDKIKAAARIYRKRNRPRLTNLANAARARRKNAPGSHSLKEWLAVKSYFGDCCAYCLKHEDTCGRLTRDHLISLTLGGNDDIENIVPACKSCNSSKNAKSLPQFVLYKTQRMAA